MYSELLAYLQCRNVHDKSYIDFVSNTSQKQKQLFYACKDNNDFLLTQIFGMSDSPDCNMQEVNMRLGLNDTDHLAIGLTDGDDVIIMNTTTSQICLWLVEENEYVHIANSFEEFLAKGSDNCTS